MELKNNPIVKAAAIIAVLLLTGVVACFVGYILKELLSIVGSILGLVLQWAIYGAVGYFIYRHFRKPKPEPEPEPSIPDEVIRLETTDKPLVIGNPFRGIFVVGAAGSGKSESIAVPLLSEFIRCGFCGLVYDFKFPTLANDIQAFLKVSGSDAVHYHVDLSHPESSMRVNPIKPGYLLNTSYAREFAQAIIANLIKESVKKPDFWNRSATDLLTACIWYLKEEHPELCDLPHVCALVSSKDEDLLRLLQGNPQTAQMTMSIYSAMERGADGQVSGVVGTLQSAIAQINTPELMYIFGGDDFSLDLNNPASPAVVTVGTYPTLAQTFAPLCSLLITVATKLMNQPGKIPSFVLLDEAPTVYIPGIDVLPNTGRSNHIATVLMCQDLAQLSDGYGKEKADVLFASCNTHFYGRVASSFTAERLSRQFGKEDKIYITESESQTGFHHTAGKSQTVQERDAAKPANFLSLEPGEFYGIAVESNMPFFRKKFRQVQRPFPAKLEKVTQTDSIREYYNRVREDVKRLLSKDRGKGDQEEPEPSGQGRAIGEMFKAGFTIED